VLGIFGLMGAGRSELARILFALDPCERGEVFLNGEPIQRVASRRRIERGLAFLTENRREEGLCLQAAISDNVALVSLGQHARRPLGLLNFGGLRKTVATIREAVRLTPTARDQAPAATLSGGNQQKVVLGKWLAAQSDLLILDEPTRGVDVGARSEIYDFMQQLKRDGKAILMISSDMTEILTQSDRILVMAAGRIVGQLSGIEATEERVLSLALRLEEAAA
jgi:ribose transport system ATP-binding protein